MEKLYAVINNGVVVNTILWDGTPCSAENPDGWSPPAGHQVIEIPDDLPVAIGWQWDGSAFTPPD